MLYKKILGTIIFPFFCLLLSFAVLITDPFFTYSLLDQSAIKHTEDLFSFFAFSSPLPEVFNQAEASHMHDVRFVILGAFILLVLFASFLFFARKHWRPIVRNGSYLLIAIIISTIFIPFDSLFKWFHLVLFPQGNWMFPATSTIISFYPSTFFLNYSISIVFHALLISAFFFCAEIVSRKR